MNYVFELGFAEVTDSEIEPCSHLPIGVLGKADGARFGHTFQSCGNIDAVAHEVAVTFLNDITQMDADAELDAALERQPGVAFDHAVLHLDRAPHRVDDTAKFDEDPVSHALDDPAMMDGDGWIDEVATESAQPRQSAIFIGAGETAKADYVGYQNRREFTLLRHDRILDTRLK
jgi:hypothetical protein